MSDSYVEVDGRRLKLSNLDKVLYPATGFTKGEVIDYYARIAPALLRHLDGRMLTLVRYPDGVEAGHFYEKNCPKHRPEWVRTAKVWSRHNNRHIYFCVADSPATLVWTANLASLEVHPSLQKAEHLERPTVVAFDLDPGPPADITTCQEVALILKDLFDTLGLQAFPKTSGKKGMQIYVPLNVDDVNFDDTKSFALAVAQLLERNHPDLVVSNMAKELRKGKVLVDWSQNDEHKTTVAVYSLRATERPSVSTPLSWDEVENGTAETLRFSPADVLDRVDRLGDLFAPVAELQQELPKFG